MGESHVCPREKDGEAGTGEMQPDSGKRAKGEWN